MFESRNVTLNVRKPAVNCVTVVSALHHMAALSSQTQKLKTSRLQEYHLLSTTNALLSSQDVPKSLSAGAPPRTRRGAYDAPPDPLVGC